MRDVLQLIDDSLHGWVVEESLVPPNRQIPSESHCENDVKAKSGRRFMPRLLSIYGENGLLLGDQPSLTCSISSYSQIHFLHE